MDRKNIKILTVVAIATLLVAVTGATFAFFAAAGGNSASTDVSAITHTTDDLLFNAGSEIELELHQGNFGTTQVGTNPEGTIDSAEGSVTFTANNSADSSACYNVSLDILTNTFEYTGDNASADPHQAELALTVTKNGTAILTNYDITTAGMGRIRIPISSSALTSYDHTIAATAGDTETDEFVVTVKAVNLDQDQNALADKQASFTGKIIYNKCGNLPEEPHPPYLAEHIEELYTTDGEGGTSNLYKLDGVGTYAANEATDNSIRYAGASASVNNYVCFGSDADTCPTANLYRIIGLFKDTNNDYQVKVIKASLATSDMLGTDGAYSSGTNYKWKNATPNTWSLSELNTTNLNTNYVSYLNNINSKWMNMVDTHTWTVAGNTYTYIRDTAGAQNVYDKEITNPSANTTYSDEIGLMYVSDYMYGASPTYWNKMGYNSSASNDMRAATGSNWLYLGSTEWTITRRSDDTGSAFYVNSFGYVGSNRVTGTYGVRPVFYLKSDVVWNGGTGASGDPYRISG